MRRSDTTWAWRCTLGRRRSQPAADSSHCCSECVRYSSRSTPRGYAGRARRSLPEVVRDSSDAKPMCFGTL